MFTRLLALLPTVATVAVAQVPTFDVGGTWALKTKSFSATVLIRQSGTAISGQFIFSGTSCASTGLFDGSITTLFSAGW